MVKSYSWSIQNKVLYFAIIHQYSFLVSEGEATGQIYSGYYFQLNTKELRIDFY